MPQGTVFENIIQIQCKNEEKHRMTIAMRLSNRTTYITKYHPTLTAHNKSLQQQLQASAESVKEGGGLCHSLLLYIVKRYFNNMGER